MELGVVAHTYNLANSREVEKGPGVQGQPELQA